MNWHKSQFDFGYWYICWELALFKNSLPGGWHLTASIKYQENIYTLHSYTQVYYVPLSTKKLSQMFLSYYFKKIIHNFLSNLACSCSNAKQCALKLSPSPDVYVYTLPCNVKRQKCDKIDFTKVCKNSMCKTKKKTIICLKNKSLEICIMYALLIWHCPHNVHMHEVLFTDTPDRAMRCYSEPTYYFVSVDKYWQW